MTKDPKKQTNPKGTITVSIGDLLKEVKQAAKEDHRSMSQQIAVIVREWLEARKAGKPSARGAVA